ncbi:hypothetical protein WMY93_019643 [Mugilogobius chulae]|uniref:DDE Tnp4 domain-containing protein n=1 Tax=Mugilogobius chulae TaxID=88201 RepID=A0AAW0NJR6_9GOBI
MEMASLREERDEARRQLNVAQCNWSKERLSARAVQGSKACKDLTGCRWALLWRMLRLSQQIAWCRPVGDAMVRSSGETCHKSPGFQACLGQADRESPQRLGARETRASGGRAPLYKAALTLLASSHFRVLGLGSRRLEGPVPLGAPLAHVAALAADCVVQAGVLGSGGPGVSAATGGEGNTCVRDQDNDTGPLARRKPPPCFLWLTLLILADRGFSSKDDFALLGASLEMPAFTRGRKQPPGKDVEESRLKSHVRIHIERVIGVLKRRFHILNGPLPVTFVKSLREEMENRDIATIDKIVHVCAALVNIGLMEVAEAWDHEVQQ